MDKAEAFLTDEGLSHKLLGYPPKTFEDFRFDRVRGSLSDSTGLSIFSLVPTPLLCNTQPDLRTICMHFVPTSPLVNNRCLSSFSFSVRCRIRARWW